MNRPHIEDLIADLANDGVLDSAGSFTLDVGKAEEKLRNFSLPRPEDYLLKAIQFAVASFAAKIQLRILPSKVEMEFLGEPVSRAELQSLMAHLAADKDAPVIRRLRHLAAALRGALAISPSSVKFQSWGDEHGFGRTWDERGWRTEQLSESRQPGFNRLIIQRTLRQSFRSAAGELHAVLDGTALTEEEQYLVSAARYCPVVIELDGQPIACQEFGAARYLGYDIASDPNPGEMRPPPFLDTSNLLLDTYAPDHHLIEACLPATARAVGGLPVPPSHASLRLGLQPGDPGECQAWLALRAAFDQPHLIVLGDGIVLLEENNPPGFAAGTRVVLAGEHLTTDLGGLAVVNDSKLHEQIAWAQAEAAKLRDEVRRAIHRYPQAEWVLSQLCS